MTDTTPSVANLHSQAIHGLPFGRFDATFSRVEKAADLTRLPARDDLF
jgi:hypothetical protein